MVWHPRCTACLQFNHTFPRQGAPDTEQIILDLTRLDVQKLSAAEGTSYPLVLRLETISAKGLEDGHTLQVRPGSLCSDPVTQPVDVRGPSQPLGLRDGACPAGAIGPLLLCFTNNPASGPLARHQVIAPQQQSKGCLASPRGSKRGALPHVRAPCVVQSADVWTRPLCPHLLKCWNHPIWRT